ncbi:MAG: FAD-dependent oxidoreductase [Vicinamibacteria bacterium]
MKRDPLALSGREHDVLVVGGGIAGAWTAYEAASRGLRTALIELEDFGQATSWSSLKTAHGGLRHLQRLDVAGFRESVAERRALLRVAPVVVRPLAFAIAAPSKLDRAKFFLGGVANDVLSFDRNEGVGPDRLLGTSQILDRPAAELLGAGPLDSSHVFTWQDAQITHTERLLMGVLHAAVEADAVILNHGRIDRSTRTAAGFAVKVADLIGGGEIAFSTRSVVNAAGAKLEAVARLFGATCEGPPLIRGVNVVLGRDLSPQVALGAKDQGRFLFLVPWMGRSILGTIYDDGARPVNDLVSELFVAGRRAFPWADIREDDVQVVHSGHVPRAANGEAIYRSRLIPGGEAPLISIMSAKYTTARATAQKAVEEIGRQLSIRLRPSVSATTLLPLAAPLRGSLSERLRIAEASEMAASPAEAWRGRLPEGADGTPFSDGSH